MDKTNNVNKTKISNYPMVSPTPIVLVGAETGGKPNYAAVGAFGVVCLAPLFYVSLKDTHYTTIGVKEHGFFSVNLPSADMVAKTDYCGVTSGHNTDKSGLFASFYDEAGKAPMIAEAPMNYLCRVVNTFPINGFTIFFGEIVSTYAGEQFLTDGRADPQKISPILGMGTTYYRLGDVIGKIFQEGKSFAP
ncbi:MAG: flavin reductase family protein [Gracilibacteraceae bacterium]|nr:flavin reductase family protein [Gracilibacteraceae bacterium]